MHGRDHRDRGWLRRPLAQGGQVSEEGLDASRRSTRAVIYRGVGAAQHRCGGHVLQVHADEELGRHGCGGASVLLRVLASAGPVGGVSAC